MDSAGTILRNGSVLVRDGKIVATWQGANVPTGVTLGNPVVIDVGPNAEVFPGLINLHDHPTFDVLEPLANALIARSANPRASARD